MSELSELLGQRIIEAARMAVQMHLAMLAADEANPSEQWISGNERNTIVGGADASVSTDGEPLLTLEDARDALSPSRAGGRMIYGLYLSATGVLTNSYRQDVIANNLANSETVGFKRDLATFVERRQAGQEIGGFNQGDPRMSRLPGGLWALPTRVDTTQGDPESGNPTDFCIEGTGYFQVKTPQGMRLTRDGRFQLDQDGALVMASNPSNKVLDETGKPLYLDPRYPFDVAKQGEITQLERPAGRIGVYSADAASLQKQGANLLAVRQGGAVAPITDGFNVRQGFVERANVDPAIELTQLMDAQRQLEANANMMRQQDQTLQRLVNDVAKIT